MHMDYFIYASIIIIRSVRISSSVCACRSLQWAWWCKVVAVISYMYFVACILPTC